VSIRTVSTREVYRNPWMRLREDEIERSDGSHGIYAVVEKDPAVILIPLDGDAIWLVGQYRYTVQQHFWELPQGGWEMADVDVEELARGELREETGLTAGKLTKLGMLWIAYGAMRQEHHVYLCEDLLEGAPMGRDAADDSRWGDSGQLHGVSLGALQGLGGAAVAPSLAHCGGCLIVSAPILVLLSYKRLPQTKP